jgi:polysaccharide transporter, PST family
MRQMLKVKFPYIYSFFGSDKDRSKIIKNIFWLFTERIFKLIVGVLVGVWVARYLGPEKFGQLNYVIAFTALFFPISNLGLDSIVVRDIVNNPKDKNNILGTAFLLRVISGLASQIIIISLYFLFSYNEGIYKIIMPLITAGIVFKAFEVIDFWFQSQVLSKFIVNARLLSFFTISLLKIVMIFFKADLVAFALVVVLEIVFDAVALIGIYIFTKHSITEWRYNHSYAKKLLIECWPMALASVSTMLYMKIDQVMIGKIIGDQAVGIYTAATRISEIWYFIPSAIVNSFTPSIVKARKLDRRDFINRNQKLLDSCVLLAYLLAIPMTFISDDLILFLYGSEYEQAGLVLSIHIWSAIFVFLGAAKNPWIITEGFLKLNSFATTIACIVNIVLNYIFLPIFGVVGAAISTLISYGIANFIVFLINPRTKDLGIMMVKSITLQNYFCKIWNKK